MKVGIKLVALLLYLILAANAAPKGNGKAVSGENEGAQAIETGGERKAGEAMEQGEVGEVGKMGEMGEAGDQGAVGEAREIGKIGEEQGLTEGGEVGEEGDNGVTVKLPTAIVKSQPPTAVTPTNEEPEATSFGTEADTTEQKAGVSGSVLPEVASNTSETSTMPLLTPDDFNYLDQNGDGFLDYRELFLGQNNVNPLYRNAAFQISDKNFDGVVDTQEFFRHPLSWGRVVAEKQFFAKNISTSGPGTSETLTSQLDVTPAAEQTYTASPDGTSSLPEDNVTTTVPSAEQSTTGLTAVDQQPSGPTDTSTRAHVSGVDQANGGQSDGTSPLPEDNVNTTVPSAEQNTTGLTAVDQQPSGPTDISTRAHVSVVDQANGGQSVALPKVTQGQKEVANGKAGSQVGSKDEVGTGSMIGHRTGDMAGDRRLGTGVVSNGDLPTANREGAVAGSTGVQAGMATGQKDQKRTGAGSSGGQSSGVPASVEGHGQIGLHGQKNGQAAFAGSAGRHAVPEAGKMGGHAMSHGVHHRISTGTRTAGVQSGVSVHPGGKIHGHTVAHSYPQTAPVSWPGKAQGHAKQYHRWDGQKWVNADVEQGVSREMGSSLYGKSKFSEYNGIAKSAGMEKKYLPDLKKEGTMAVAQSEEDDDEESSNEEEDKKDKNKSGKGDGDNEYDDTDDNDEKYRE